MDDPTKRRLGEWLDDIAESEDQLAAGEIIPAEPVLQMLRDSIAELEAKLAARHVHAATLRR